MSKTITVDISPDGTAKVEASGFQGKGCQAATKVFEDALGVVVSRELKPEAQEQVTLKQSVSGS